MANKPGEANFFPDVPQFPSMGAFQPVYGKFDLTTYIQGASDYEIMAFLVGKYNACLEAYGTITKLSTDTITACKQLQDWINSWFTNLDVQKEINNKLDSMVADGSFGTLLHQTFDAQINQQTTNAVTQWLVANVTPAGSAVVVDKSLSIGGAAADAKEAGDELAKRPQFKEIVIGSPSGEYTGDTLFGNLKTNTAYLIWRNAVSAFTDVINAPDDSFFHVMPMGNSAYVESSLEPATYMGSKEDVTVLISTESKLWLGSWNFTTKTLTISAPFYYTTDKTLLITNKPADSKTTGDELAKRPQFKEIVIGSPSGEYTGDTLFGNLKTNTAYLIWRNAVSAFTDVINAPDDSFFHVMPMGNSAYVESSLEPATYMGSKEDVTVLISTESKLWLGSWNFTTKTLTISAPFYYTTDKTLLITNKPADSKTTGDELAKRPQFKEIVIGSPSGEYTGDTLFGNLKTNTAYLIWRNAVSAFTDVINAPDDSFFHVMPMGNSAYVESSLEPARYLQSKEKITVLISTDDKLCLGSWDVSTRKFTINKPFYAGVPEQHPEQHKETNFISLTAFPKIGVIGDSFASGVIIAEPNSITNYNLSWPQELARLCGVSAFNFSKGGLTTATWLTDKDYGLPKLLATEKQNIYMISLGINDNGLKIPIGTVDDIHDDYNDNPATFYGNLGRIIDQIKNYATKAKIVLITTPVTYTDAYNTAIINTATHYGIPCLISNSDDFFQSEFYKKSMKGGHPTALSYSGMALAYQRLFNKTAQNFISYFADYTGNV